MVELKVVLFVSLREFAGGTGKFSIIVLDMNSADQEKIARICFVQHVT